MATKYRGYDVVSGKHGSPQEEWSPHKAQTEKAFEWWYITNILDNKDGEKLFFHVILFHFSGANYLQAVGLDRNAGQGHYVLSLGLSDYANGIRVEERTFARIEDDYDPIENTMKFDANDISLAWSYQDDTMKIGGRSPRQEVELALTDERGVLWHKDKMGIQGLIAESSPDEPSFYYSIPALKVDGTLSYADEKGNKIRTKVEGQGWCDRQWGDYMTRTWEWCSMRFLDGDRINLYAFPQTGHKIGSYLNRDGKVEYFDNFTVWQKVYFEAPNGVWLASAWDYELPVKAGKYRVRSASQKDFVIGSVQTYFEGMGYIYNEKDELVGYTANESMDIKETGTGPYKSKI